MALEVGIVGLPGAGKTTLFTALTRTGGGGFGKENVGMALDRRRPARRSSRSSSARARSRRRRCGSSTCPGTGPQLLGGLRQVDAILAVADGLLAGRGSRATTSRRSSSSCSSPTATTSSGGSSASRSRRSRATRRCARRSSSCRRCSRTSRAGTALRDCAGELPRGARAADDEAAARGRATGRTGSTCSWRRSSRSCRTRRRPSSARARRRSTRSCGGCATRST